MAYSKITTIVGNSINKPADFSDWSIQQRADWLNANTGKSTYRRGFWKVESVTRLAEKMGFVGSVSCSHDTIDGSGKGRGSSENFTIVL